MALIKGLRFFIALSVVCIIGILITSYPGEVKFEWFGYFISIPIGLFFACLVVIFAFITSVHNLWRWVWNLPQNYLTHLQKKRVLKGNNLLIDGLSAIAAGQNQEAKEVISVACELLPENPLTQFIAAQASYMTGDEEAATRQYLAMQKDKRTSFLGLRGLILQAKAREDYKLTQEYITKALTVRPDSPWLQDEYLLNTVHLAQKGISCPRPILDNQGAMIVDLVGKKSSIVTFLEGANLKTRADGYYDNITPQHCFEAGAMLGKMHIAAQDFALKRENDLGVKGLRPLFSKFEDLTKNFTYADFLSNNDFVKQNIHAEIIAALEFLEKSWRVDLPSAAAHLDFFPDNLFFDKNNKASGVIDFYFAANDALIYDFAIAVNAWCFDENNNFSQEKFLALKNGYENFRKFSVAELDFLKIALCGAAMRFLLTRLHDMFFTPQNSLVKIKNPQEYLAKLRFFLSEFK